jgi:hypothetical protein
MDRLPQRKRQRSKKPKPTPKGKAKGAPRKAPQRRKKQRSLVKPVRRPRTDVVSAIASKFSGQFKEAKSEECVDPTIQSVRASDTTYLAVLAAIDEFLAVMMRNKPTLFTWRDATNGPTVPFNMARALYLTGFQWYMWNLQCMSSNYLGPTSIGKLKIPLGLAKIFQQYAPYCDPITGSTYRTIVNAINYNVNVEYPDVDTNTGGAPLTNLNAPYRRYLIHASRWSGATTYIDFCSNGNKSVTPYTSSVTDFFLVYNNPTLLPESVSRSLEAMCTTVAIQEIPKYAPDASAYCDCSPSVVSCPVPSFRADMGIICNGPPGLNPPDLLCMNAYDKPFPVVRINQGGVETTDTGAKYQTLVSVYAALTFNSTAWESGDAISLLRSCKEFRTVTEISYREATIDFTKMARKVFQIYKLGTFVNNQEGDNTSFAFSMFAWSALFSRLVPYATLSCSSDIGSNICFWVDNLSNISFKFPAALLRVLSSVGPTVQDGKVYFPALASFVNSSVANNNGWTSTLSTTGVWNVGTTAFSLAPGVTPVSGPQTISYPGSSTPVTRVADGTLVYNLIPAALASQFAIYQLKFPAEFQPDSMNTVSDNILGTKFGMMAPPTSNAAVIGTSAWSNTVVQSSTYEQVLAVQGSVCINLTDVINSAAYGILANLPSSANNIKPLVHVLESNTVEVANIIQRGLTPAGNSQYQAITKANLEKKAFGISRKKKSDPGFVSSVLQTQTQTDGIKRAFGDASGNRDTAKEQLAMSFKDALTNGAKMVAQKVGAMYQDEFGSLLQEGFHFLVQNPPNAAPRIETLINARSNQLTHIARSFE